MYALTLRASSAIFDLFMRWAYQTKTANTLSLDFAYEGTGSGNMFFLSDKCICKTNAFIRNRWKRIFCYQAKYFICNYLCWYQKVFSCDYITNIFYSTIDNCMWKKTQNAIEDHTLVISILMQFYILAIDRALLVKSLYLMILLYWNYCDVAINKD